MKFVNMRELSRSPSKYVKLAKEKDDIVITRNGHPCAVLLKIDEGDIEDFILAKHFDLESEFETAKFDHEDGKTTNVYDLLNEIDGSIGS